ncbi:hypothetical protein V5O48_014360 [Marasmius crinis-equi]|uniref:Uncharacterized protein n=1 Tax=Marasmius crinis-equi TaxID=585013 RepID=A0ABR3EXJ7_9AGAR
MTTEVLGVSTAKMEYKHFDHLITREHGVTIVGWPLGKFSSELGSALGPLAKAKAALEDGSCYFRKLNSAEHKAWLKKYEKDLASGDAVAPARKQRRDAGISRGPRKKPAKEAGDGDETDEEDEEDEWDDEWEGIESGNGVVVADGEAEDDDDAAIDRALSKAKKSKKGAAKKVTSSKVKEKVVKATEAGEKAAKQKAVAGKRAAVPSSNSVKPSTGNSKKRKAQAIEDEFDAPGLIVAVRSPPPPNRPQPIRRPHKQTTADPSNAQSPIPDPSFADPSDAPRPTPAPSGDIETSTPGPNASVDDSTGMMDVDKDTDEETRELRARATDLGRKMNGLNGEYMLPNDSKRIRKPSSRRM